VRRLVGPTDPRKGGPDTLRGRFAKIPAASPTYYRNVVHAATDPVEVAANLDTLNVKLVEEWRVVP
jgi:nucleoside diphosphate kinase